MPENKKRNVGSTRYYRYARPIFLYFTSVFLALLLLEAGSFITLSISVTLEKSIPYREALSLFVNQHPWNEEKENPVTNFFHPITQFRGKAGVPWSGLETNEYGFIHNGHDISLLNSFPEKPEGLLRIIVLGGSSAAGVTASENEHTISAILETQLNKQWGKSDVSLQVLNFGVPGQYVFGELTLLVSEVIHLDPDLVITLDGFNDISYVVNEHEIQKLELPLMNWADFSYWDFDQLNGYGVMVDPPPPPIFTYTFLLLRKILRPNVERSRWSPERLLDSGRQFAYHDLANFRLSEWNYRRFRFHENALKVNLSTIAALLVQRKVPYLGYLQPHPLEFKDTTAEEVEKKKLFGNGLQNSQRISAMQVFSDIYKELDQEYIGTSEVRFHDLRGLFEGIKKPIYNDSIHYNKYGNQLISERLMADISIRDGHIRISQTLDNAVAQALAGEALLEAKIAPIVSEAEDIFVPLVEIPVGKAQSLERLKKQKRCVECNLADTDLTWLDLYQVNLSGADLRNAKLSVVGQCDRCTGKYMVGANLRDTNLSGAALAQASLARADLRSSDLRGADLRWANLTGASLVSATLDRANLTRANLRGVDLESTSLNETTFSGVNLRKTDLSGLKLIDVNMSFADLTGSNLERVNLQGSNMTAIFANDANFSNANLAGANLTRSHLIESNLTDANLARTNLNDANLYNANFRRVNLSDSSLVGADMSRSDFRNANLNNANLSRATLRWTNLRNSNLEDANLNGADLLGADLGGANVLGTSFVNANLEGTNLSQIQLYDADLTGSSFGGGDLSRRDLRSAKLKEANLQNMNLSYVILDKADLRWANLRDTNLSNSQLVETNLTGARLDGADLSDTNFYRARLVETSMVAVTVDGIDLRNADLSNANLVQIDFSGANLEGVKLVGANLNEISLAGTSLKSADLSGLNLSGLNLRHTNLSGARLVNVNLDNADLTKTNLKHSDMRNASLENTIYCQTTMPDGSENNSNCS